jgi:hypothetical protein
MLAFVSIARRLPQNEIRYSLWSFASCVIASYAPGISICVFMCGDAGANASSIDKTPPKSIPIIIVFNRDRLFGFRLRFIKIEVFSKLFNH